MIAKRSIPTIVFLTLFLLYVETTGVSDRLTYGKGKKELSINEALKLAKQN